MKIQIDKNKKKYVTRIFILCWLVYFTSYIGRLNFPSVMAKIMEEGIITESQAGLINMIYFLAYGFGQISNGIIGDKSKPRIQIFVGLICSGISNLMMCWQQPVAMLIFWGANGYFQSMIWPPIMRIFAEKFTGDQKVKASINIVSSMVLGSLASYLMSALALYIDLWKSAFCFAAGSLILVAWIWFFQYKNTEKRFEFAAPPKVLEIRSKQSKSADKRSRSNRTVLTCFLILLLPTVIHGILKDGVPSWIPTFFHERFGVSTAYAAVVTMVLPIINLSGAYMAGFVNKKFKNYEVKSSSLFFIIAAFALFMIRVTGQYSIILTGFLFALVTASMMAVDTLLVNIVPLHFEQVGKVSTVSGILNAFSHFGSAFASLLIGIMVENSGWNMAINSWIIETLIAGIFCILIRNKNIYK